MTLTACDPGYDVSATNPCADPVKVGFQANRTPTLDDFAYEVPGGEQLVWSTIGTWDDEVNFILLSGPRRGDVLVRTEPHIDIPHDACPNRVS